MISLYTIITILVSHFLVDFFYQSDRMAQGKSKNNCDLEDHVTVYAIGVLAIIILNCNHFTFGNGVAFFVINVGAHYFTDYFSSRSTSNLWEKKEYHDFFCTIGLDQLVHYITLFGTFVWLTN